MTKQCKIILNRLREGQASNSELLRISKAKNLSARISDLRRAGYNVVCVKIERKKGLAWYILDSLNKPEKRTERTKVKCHMRLCKFVKKEFCTKSAINIYMHSGLPTCVEYVPVVKGQKP